MSGGQSPSLSPQSNPQTCTSHMTMEKSLCGPETGYGGKGGFSRDWKETKVFQLWWRGVVCCADTRRTVLASVGRNVTACKVTGKFQLMWWVFFLSCNFIDTGHPFEI